VLAAYGVPDSVLQQPQAKLFIYSKRGVLMWVMDDKVINFTVIEQEKGNLGPVIGIGAALGKQDDRVVVQHVLAGSPAESAGLQPGDELREIDGQPLKGNLEEVVKRIRGEADTVVKIKVRRKDGTEVELAIPRRTIALPPAESRK
jgi:C-terminal processing protease CtpA/Prc